MATPPWLPAPLVLACSADCRSPECLRQVLAQFDVEHDERYKPDTFGCPGTRCNIATTDFTRALECEIPHVVDNNGHPVKFGSPGSHEMTALGMIGWLRVFGSDNGWQAVAAPSARILANQGRPVVVAWTHPNPAASSHIAVLLPTPDGEPEPRVAAAGRVNVFDKPLSSSFGHAKPLEYWFHE